MLAFETNEQVKPDQLICETRGLVYECDYIVNKENSELKIRRAYLFSNATDALIFWSNLRNAPSQIARGASIEEFEESLNKLNSQMSDQKWVNELKEYL